nr:MAG TPA: hypothetical protein [Caudoviricetes sp.]
MSRSNVGVGVGLPWWMALRIENIGRFTRRGVCKLGLTLDGSIPLLAANPFTALATRRGFFVSGTRRAGRAPAGGGA